MQESAKKVFAPMDTFLLEDGMVFEIDGAPEEDSLVKVEAQVTGQDGPKAFVVRGVYATFLNISLDERTFQIPADLSVRLVPNIRLGSKTGTLLDRVLA